METCNTSLLLLFHHHHHRRRRHHAIDCSASAGFCSSSSSSSSPSSPSSSSSSSSSSSHYPHRLLRLHPHRGCHRRRHGCAPRSHSRYHQCPVSSPHRRPPAAMNRTFCHVRGYLHSSSGTRMRINALSTDSSNGGGGGEEEEENQEVRKSNDEEEIGEINQGEEEKEEGEERKEDILAYAGELLEPEGWIVLMSCAIGVMTGVGVVLFNLGVHELHDIVWHGIPSSGATWLRKQPLEKHWVQLLSVPTGGGIVVGVLNYFRNNMFMPSVYASKKASQNDQTTGKLATEMKEFLEPVLKSLAALVTLGTGNSLGPEGPSVEIGASIANGLGTAFKNSRERKMALIAAGSAAGISSGFNAAISGCFFAVESVLRPLSADSAPSLTTAMVLLSSVLASVISQAGLGSDPAFKIPAYDFRSPAELPLYLVLGALSGLVSVGLTKCSNFSTDLFQKFKTITGIPDAILPSIGGISVGLIALSYPEVLYWGFENVDILLELRLFQRGPPAILLLQLVGAKIIATSICRGSGLVGGFYAPSLFIGAALGSAYGDLAGYIVTHADPMYHLDALKVALPQAYALVGMAATLAGVCQVPLTSVLLLFELTRDYRIILPLMAAVGVSSWVASTLARNKKQQKNMYKEDELRQVGKISRVETPKPNDSSPIDRKYSDGLVDARESMQMTEGLCAIDNSLCVANNHPDEDKLLEEIMVADAMRTNFVAVTASMSIQETLSIMLARKEWCAFLVHDTNILEGLVTLSDIQQEATLFFRDADEKERKLTISEICNSWVNEDARFPVITVYPDMSLKIAWRLMSGRGLRQLPVVSREQYVKENVKVVEGILDRECIQLACRAEATRRLLERIPVSGTVSDREIQGQS